MLYCMNDSFHDTPHEMEGFLLLDKPEGRTSFSMVAEVRRISKQKKIGHAGTLDPFATGLLVLLLGKKWTRRANEFMGQHKRYETVVRLGITTDSYDRDGAILDTSNLIPTLSEIQEVLPFFQGTILQVPPMFSAKKVQGKRLYEHAREGKTIERKPCPVTIQTTLVGHSYPYLRLQIDCSKGTYIRSIGHEIGVKLGCGAHLCELRRTHIGSFCVDKALPSHSLTFHEIQKNLHI